ncbi:MAG: helix-turn-helix domain-containing protein [Rhodospirillales bacterium]|nr:helix-turn-helix domain-containing protein [Rhodospirillales bacterium]
MSETKLAYRPAEVQAALGIKHSKFWELVKAGKLESRKLGSATVVPAESLRDFIANLPKANAA